MRAHLEIEEFPLNEENSYVPRDEEDAESSLPVRLHLLNRLARRRLMSLNNEGRHVDLSFQVIVVQNITYIFWAFVRYEIVQGPKARPGTKMCRIFSVNGLLMATNPPPLGKLRLALTK
jgi:hypothetical protein